jgi:hypothetical protein
MNGTPKRGRDGSNHAQPHGSKYARHDNGKNREKLHTLQSGPNGPALIFYNGLKTCRAIVATIDVPAMVSALPAVLRKLADSGRALLSLSVDFGEFMEPFRKLQQFAVRDKATTQTIIK